MWSAGEECSADLGYGYTRSPAMTEVGEGAVADNWTDDAEEVESDELWRWREADAVREGGGGCVGV